jgi:hypothetical protein
MAMERVSSICEDCIILAGEMRLEYADGKVVDTAQGGVYNHHLTISQMGKPSKNMICPSGMSMGQISMSPLVGTASDASTQLYTTEDGEFQSGFFSKKGETSMLNFQLINYKPAVQEGKSHVRGQCEGLQ